MVWEREYGRMSISWPGGKQTGRISVILIRWGCFDDWTLIRAKERLEGLECLVNCCSELLKDLNHYFVPTLETDIKAHNPTLGSSLTTSSMILRHISIGRLSPPLLWKRIAGFVWTILNVCKRDATAYLSAIVGFSKEEACVWRSKNYTQSQLIQ